MSDIAYFGQDEAALRLPTMFIEQRDLHLHELGLYALIQDFPCYITPLYSANLLLIGLFAHITL